MQPAVVELIVLIAVAALGLYAFVSMRGSIQEDREGAAALRQFADLRGLREEPARGPEPVRELTGDVLRRRFARSPAEVPAPRGSARYVGSVDGLTIAVDTPLLRRRFVDLYDPWARMAIELPGLPPELRVRPRTRADVLVQPLGLGARATGDAAFDRVFVQRGDPGSWLGRERRSALLEAARRLGRLEIVAGRLCLVRPGQPPPVTELDRLASELAQLARMLGSADAAA